MENLKKELMDFLDYVSSSHKKTNELVIDNYIKQKKINSCGLDEAKAVGQNKDEKKDCKKCGSKYINIPDLKLCNKCYLDVR